MLWRIALPNAAGATAILTIGNVILVELRVPQQIERPCVDSLFPSYYKDRTTPPSPQ